MFFEYFRYHICYVLRLNYIYSECYVEFMDFGFSIVQIYDFWTDWCCWVILFGFLFGLWVSGDVGMRCVS